MSPPSNPLERFAGPWLARRLAAVEDVVGVLRHAWPTVAGEGLAAISRPARLEGSTLVVAVVGGGAANPRAQLEAARRELLRRVASWFPSRVDAIVIETDESWRAPSSAPRRPPVKGERDVGPPKARRSEEDADDDLVALMRRVKRLADQRQDEG